VEVNRRSCAENIMAQRKSTPHKQGDVKFALPGQGPNFYKMEVSPAKIRSSNNNDGKPLEREEEILVEDIAPSPNQKRQIKINNAKMQELVNSIKEVGLIQAISVRPNTDETSKYKWILVAGERRLTAHKILGLKYIRAHINEKDDLEASWAKGAAENFIREDLTPEEAFNTVEQAKKDYAYDVGTIAEKLGLTEMRVYQIHGTAKLPKDLLGILSKAQKNTKRHIDAFKMLIGRNTLESFEISNTDPSYIVEVKNKIKTLLQEITEGNLSGEESINLAKELKNPEKVKSFLSTPIKRLVDAIKRRPGKMTDKKRIFTINQAEKAVTVLTEYIEEQKKLIKNPKSTTPT